MTPALGLLPSGVPSDSVVVVITVIRLIIELLPHILKSNVYIINIIIGINTLCNCLFSLFRLSLHTRHITRVGYMFHAQWRRATALSVSLPSRGATACAPGLRLNRGISVPSSRATRAIRV